jgi:CSLREA domain-containing protein/MYXO-CTERM domain-containing protein
MVVLLGGAVHAASFTVTSTGDDSDPSSGSLRAAIGMANSVGGSNSITFTISGTINLGTELPPLSGDLTIRGPGADQLTIQPMSGKTFRVFTVTNSGRFFVQISGITIKGGDASSADGGASSADGGGGILVKSDGALSLVDSVVSDNSGNIGAAISSSGSLLIIQRTTISGNHGNSAIYAAGSDTTLLTDSTVSGNTGTAIVYSPPAGMPANLTIDRCAISGNSFTSGVGGLELQGGKAKISNSTFSGNSGVQASDFWPSGAGTLTLINVTAVGGSAPSLLFDQAATISARNTIFAGAGTRCSLGTHTISQGHNLSTDATCGLTAAGDQASTDPLLGPLANNSGPQMTLTHALLKGSPAIDSGDSASVEQNDQRTRPRVQLQTVDIGAFECDAPIIDTQPVAQTLLAGETLTLSVTAHSFDGSTLEYQWRKDGVPIAGATASTYSKTPAQPSDVGSYDVTVGNACSLASQAVTVVVTPGPDMAPPADLSASPPVGGDSGCACSTHGGPHSSNWVLLLAVMVAVLVYRRATV